MVFRAPAGYLSSLREACGQRSEFAIDIDGNQKLILDEHQSEAMEKVEIAIECRKMSARNNAASILHCCGAGKTVLEANIIAASQEAKMSAGLNNDRKDLILTTERSLLYSLEGQLQDLNVDAGVWGGGRKMLDRPVQLATIAALQKSKNRLRKLFPNERLDLVIGDEADCYLTEARKKIIGALRPSFKLGLTATKEGPNGSDISDVWGPIIDELSLEQGILKGINVPPLWYLYEVNVREDDLKVVGDDFDANLLARGLEHAQIHRAIPEVYKSHIPKNRRGDFPTLIYVPSVGLVHATEKSMKENFASSGLRIHAWTGKTNSSEIEEDMSKFNQGKIDVLILCRMGGRGLDLPRARFLIDGDPTLSSKKLIQRHGRVIRKVREGTELHDAGFRKPYAGIAQIVPAAKALRAICLPDVLSSSEEAWKDAQAGRPLLVKNVPRMGQLIADEVEGMRQLIERKELPQNVKLIRNLDVFKEIQRLDRLPRADEHDCFVKNGEKYGSIYHWMDELNLKTRTAVDKKLRPYRDSHAIDGFNQYGLRQKYFYPESLIRQVLSHHVTDLPKADKDGFFLSQEDWYGTEYAWSQYLGLSRTVIKSRLSKHGINGVQGKDYYSRVQTFFSQEDVWAACEDVISARQDLPKADEKTCLLTVTEGGTNKKYATIHNISRKFGVSNSVVKRRAAILTPVRGIDARGAENDFYSLKEMKALISATLQANSKSKLNKKK